MNEIKTESITILAITHLNRDKVNLVGITDNGQWIRIINLLRRDLKIEDKDIKSFNKIKICCLKTKGVRDRREDRLFLFSEKRRIQIFNKLNIKEQRIFMDKYLDDSIAGIINNYRSIGIVKPVISKIEFDWNSYRCSYEARFVFKDSKGDKYNFLCNDSVWHNYWIDYLRREPMNINSQLLKIQWTLNRNITYFVVGFTKRFSEIPGPNDGRWPIVLAVHTIQD